MKNLRFLLIGSFVLILLIAGGFFLWQNVPHGSRSRPTPQPSTNTTNGEGPSLTNTSPDAAAFDAAYANRDRAKCDEIQNEPTKKLCHVYVTNAQAKEKKDPKLCEEITDSFYRTDCLDNMTIFFARERKDAGRCNELINKERLAECKAAVGQ